jgi:ribosome-associated protein
MASAETRKMVLAAAAAGEEKKAEDTRILELDPSESGFTDFFLIMSGTNTRQVVAISDQIELRLKREFGTYANAVEGRRLGEWVLMDYVDFVVHVFVAEKRAYYDIERLRKSATTLDIEQLKTALTQKVKAARKKSAVKKASTATGVKKKATKKLPLAGAKAPAAKKAASNKPEASGESGSKTASKKPAKKSAK